MTPNSFFIAAPFTPFDASGELNLGAIDALAEHLVRSGARGAFVCGTTGESASLSLDERCTVAKRWVEVSKGSLEIIVHAGHANVREASALAQHAQQIGADGVAALSPYFFKPRGVEDAIEVASAIASAAPQTRFYHYHIPSMTNVDFSVADFLIQARGRIPNLAGAKLTYENLLDYARCLEVAPGELEIFFGRDEIALAGLALGARSAVGSTYTFGLGPYARLLESFCAGNLVEARAQQAQARRSIEVFVRHGGLSAMKAAMKWRGVDCGPSRLPLRVPDEAGEKQLREELEQAGFFEAFVN